MYFSIFHSHLLYCPLIVNCATKTNIQKIAVMQKKAIRSITNSKSNSHTDPLFSSLNILPYHKIIYKSQLMFFHSIHNHLLSSMSGKPTLREIPPTPIEMLMSTLSHLPTLLSLKGSPFTLSQKPGIMLVI